MLQNSTQKIKRKQTVNDFEQMQTFISETVENNKLGGLINKTARLDKNFDAFMDDLQKSDTEPSSADVSKNPKSPASKPFDENQYDKEINDLISDIKRTNESEKDLSFEDKLFKYRDYDDLVFDQEGEFRIMLMDQRVTSNTTSLRRINSFKALVYAGNCNGVIGYGKGRALNFKRAIQRAVGDCKQNLVAINLDLLNTMPQAMYAKFGRYKIILWPRKYNNAWGSPKFSTMLQMAGIRHCMFKFIYDSPNPYALVYCVMKILTQNTTPKLLSEELGKKLYDNCWARRGYKDLDMDSMSL